MPHLIELPDLFVDPSHHSLDNGIAVNLTTANDLCPFKYFMLVGSHQRFFFFLWGFWPVDLMQIGHAEPSGTPFLITFFTHRFNFLGIVSPIDLYRNANLFEFS